MLLTILQQFVMEQFNHRGDGGSREGHREIPLWPSS